MKFNKGAWQLREDVSMIYPARTHEYDAGKDDLTVYLASSREPARGALIGGSIFNVRYSSPLPGIIRVQASHFKGRAKKKPEFDIGYDQKAQGVTCVMEENAALFSSGPLTARVST